MQVTTSFEINDLSVAFYNSSNQLLDARWTPTNPTTGNTFQVTWTAPANTTTVRVRSFAANYDTNDSTLAIGNASLIEHNPATTTTEIHRYTQGATLDPAGNILERTIALPGGVNLTKRTTGEIWAYPNIHGDTQAATNNTGLKEGPTRTYDPYGTPLAGTPDTNTGTTDSAWLGQHHKRLEHLPGLQPTIQMGARPYNPTLGRFLEVDPVEGGTENDYTYPTDPVNMFDLDGRMALPNMDLGMCTGRDERGCGKTFIDRRHPSNVAVWNLVRNKTIGWAHKPSLQRRSLCPRWLTSTLDFAGPHGLVLDMHSTVNGEVGQGVAGLTAGGWINMTQAILKEGGRTGIRIATGVSMVGRVSSVGALVCRL